MVCSQIKAGDTPWQTGVLLERQTYWPPPALVAARRNQALGPSHLGPHRHSDSNFFIAPPKYVMRTHLQALRLGYTCRPSLATFEWESYSVAFVIFFPSFSSHPGVSTHVLAKQPYWFSSVSTTRCLEGISISSRQYLMCRDVPLLQQFLMSSKRHNQIKHHWKHIFSNHHLLKPPKHSHSLHLHFSWAVLPVISGIHIRGPEITNPKPTLPPPSHRTTQMVFN